MVKKKKSEIFNLIVYSMLLMLFPLTFVAAISYHNINRQKIEKQITVSTRTDLLTIKDVTMTPENKKLIPKDADVLLTDDTRELKLTGEIVMHNQLVGTQEVNFNFDIMKTNNPQMDNILRNLVEVEQKVKKPLENSFKKYNTHKKPTLMLDDNRLTFETIVTLNSNKYQQLSELEKELFKNPNNFNFNMEIELLPQK